MVVYMMMPSYIKGLIGFTKEVRTKNEGFENRPVNVYKYEHPLFDKNGRLLRYLKRSAKLSGAIIKEGIDRDELHCIHNSNTGATSSQQTSQPALTLAHS